MLEIRKDMTLSELEQYLALQHGDGVGLEGLVLKRHSSSTTNVVVVDDTDDIS